MKTVKTRFIFLGISIITLFLTSWMELFLQKKQNIVGGGLNRIVLFLLINVHILAIVTLLYFIGMQSIKFFLERQKEAPGSVFRRNLLFAFTIFSVLPTFFVFFVAGNLITTNIDDWFNAHIDSGLQHSLQLHDFQTKKIKNLLKKQGKNVAAHIKNDVFFDQKKIEKKFSSLKK